MEVRQSNGTRNFYLADERRALQDKSSAISCTVTHVPRLLHQRKAWPCGHMRGKGPSVLPFPRRHRSECPRAPAPIRAFLALERGAQGSTQDSSQALAPREQGRLSLHPPEQSVGHPRGCSEPLSQRSPGGCSGLYKLIKGLM